MPIKINDIAKMANVSKATVSLALNGSELIKEETREKIIKISKELGYSPNAIAKGLAKSKSNTIGLVIPDIEDVFCGKLIRYIDENVSSAGYNLILAISNDKPETEKKIIKNFISQRVEGVIINPVNSINNDPGYVKDLGRYDIPYLFVSAHYPLIDSTYIMVDLEEGSYKLVKYILELSHRNIYFLVGIRDVVSTEYRINGYIRAFKDKGIPVDASCFIDSRRYDYENAYENTERLIKSGKRLDAIIAINDTMALGAINALKANGIKVPEDVSVAGYDNMLFSIISPVPITTVKQDVERMSRIAVDKLTERIKNKSMDIEKIMIKPELIIRESTAVRK